MKQEEHIEPPKWAIKLLVWYCPDSLLEEIEGDLLENFAYNLKKRGTSFAKWHFIIDAIRFCNPTTFKKAKNIGSTNYRNPSNHIAMIKHYYKIALRQFARHKVSTFLNLTGLSVGIAASLLILQYVNQEQHYDQFHDQTDQIYRIALVEGKVGSMLDNSAINYFGMGEAFKAELPEVLDFSTLHDREAIVSYQDKQFREPGLFYVDSNFLQFFSFTLLKGNPKTALSKPNTVILTDEMVAKYFSNENPLGQSIKLNNKEELEITGVVEKPRNSHIQFDFLINNANFVENRYRQSGTIWKWSNFYVYAKLETGTDPLAIEAKFPGVIKKYKEVGEGQILKAFLQPIQDIHLHSHLSWEIGANGNEKVIYALLFIALMILLIAWVNYVNLYTAQATQRAKEVGVRKVAGATRGQLIKQFMIQSFLLNFVAVIIAIGLKQLAEPFFEQLTGIPLFLSLFEQTYFLLGFAAFFLTGVFFSGLYPGFILSGFQPVKVLKDGLSKGGGGIFLRKSLTVFQFATSIILIVGTIVLYRQIYFMQQSNLGFNDEQTIVLKGPKMVDSTYSHKLVAFKNALPQQAGIKLVSSSSSVPGQEMTATISGIRRKGLSKNEGHLMEFFYTDEDFLPTYQMELLAGRNFLKDVASETYSILINQTALSLLGYVSPAEAIDQLLEIGSGKNNQYRIVGVIKDYHHHSLKEQITPIIINYDQKQQKYYSINVAANELPTTLAFIEEKYASFFTGNPFEYFFLDKAFNSQYEAENRLSWTLLVFACLTIFIACLGLYGLASFTVSQRTKEIGIRKVLGASSSGIVSLLSKDFLSLVFVSLLIATPLAFYFMQQWLADFPYRIHIDWWIFVLAGLLAIFIAALTISFQSIRAALANPIKSLRNE